MFADLNLLLRRKTNLPGAIAVALVLVAIAAHVAWRNGRLKR